MNSHSSQIESRGYTSAINDNEYLRNVEEQDHSRVMESEAEGQDYSLVMESASHVMESEAEGQDYSLVMESASHVMESALVEEHKKTKQKQCGSGKPPKPKGNSPKPEGNYPSSTIKITTPQVKMSAPQLPISVDSDAVTNICLPHIDTAPHPVLGPRTNYNTRQQFQNADKFIASHLSEPHDFILSSSKPYPFHSHPETIQGPPSIATHISTQQQFHKSSAPLSGPHLSHGLIPPLSQGLTLSGTSRSRSTKIESNPTTSDLRRTHKSISDQQRKHKRTSDLPRKHERTFDALKTELISTAAMEVLPLVQGLVKSYRKGQLDTTEAMKQLASPIKALLTTAAEVYARSESSPETLRKISSAVDIARLLPPHLKPLTSVLSTSTGKHLYEIVMQLYGRKISSVVACKQILDLVGSSVLCSYCCYLGGIIGGVVGGAAGGPAGALVGAAVGTFAGDQLGKSLWERIKEILGYIVQWIQTLLKLRPK